MTELTTTVLRKSRGAKIVEGDAIAVWFEGELLNGERFDANYDFTTFDNPFPTPNYLQSEGNFLLNGFPSNPYKFVVGAGGVIAGWNQAFSKGRRVGEVVELTIPADLAYGEEGAGEIIPPNSDLRFTIEVLGVSPQDEEPFVFPQLSDLGVNTKKLGLEASALEDLQSIKIGLDGADRIIGNNTNDLLVGLKGNDKLFGAGGADVLIGGKGTNRFRYTDITDSLAGKDSQDSIYGFGNKDKINLRGLDAELSFIGADKFSGTAGDVRFHNETLKLDLDGDATTDFAIALPGTTKLKASNLIL